MENVQLQKPTIEALDFLNKIYLKDGYDDLIFHLIYDFLSNKKDNVSELKSLLDGIVDHIQVLDAYLDRDVGLSEKDAENANDGKPTA